MNLKERLQRMLQIVEDSERVGALADIERDILLNELREAYTELKFGQTENGERKTENEPVDAELPITPIVPSIPIVAEEKVDPIAEPTVEPVAESIVENEELSTLNSQLSTKKRSALLSLYEEEPKPVIGEQFHEKSVADTIACPKGVAESTPVVSLHDAIGVADKFMLIRELFDGDAEAYEKALNVLEAQPSFDDCIIYISENYSWSPNAESTKFLMELLNRKYN